MHIYLVQMNPTVGALKANGSKICKHIHEAEKCSADLVVFSELILTGYPPQDFLHLPHFMKEVEKELMAIASEVKESYVLIGVPRFDGETLFNSVALLHKGGIFGYQDKTLLPTYDVFDERRYFEPAHSHTLWEIAGKKIAVTVCEDIWQLNGPLLEYRKSKPDLLINLSASPYSVKKPATRVKIASQAALVIGAPVVLCNQVGGNDSLIFDGSSVAVDSKGSVSHAAPAFEEYSDLWKIEEKSDQCTFYDETTDLKKALVLGIRDYFHKQGFKSALIGLSGGIDSAVVTALAVEALGKENVKALLMPSRYSSKGSVEDSKELVENFGISSEIISIEPFFETYLKELNLEGSGVTEENLQARIRGVILMAHSNKSGALVLSTGNKSELALGYCTLYGDMVGALSVLGDVTKTQVYSIAKTLSRIPNSIIEKPPSAELRENQKDSDSLPDYAVIDAILERYLVQHESPKEIAEKEKLPLELVEELVRRIHSNEYKRRQAAPLLRVSEKAFSIGRRLPIVQGYI